MTDPIEWAKSVADLVKTYVSRSLSLIESRLDALEAKPIRGEPGKDVDPEEVRRFLEGKFAIHAEEQKNFLRDYFQSIPIPKDGISVTLDDVRPMIRELLQDIEIPKPQDGKSVTLEDVRPMIEECVRNIPIPKPRDLSPEDVRPMVEELVRAIPVPTPKDGEPGKSVTLEEVRQMWFDAYTNQQNAWALDFERRAQDILHRAIDRIEKPKDGEDGKDGVSFDQFNVEQISERLIRHTWSKDGVVVKTLDQHVRCPIYREIFKQGQAYEQDDMVTFGGSVWIALRDTDSKPGTDDSWRLCVKAGRDAK